MPVSKSLFDILFSWRLVSFSTITDETPKNKLCQPVSTEVIQMSTSAPISNPEKITPSNICCDCRFFSVCQFSPSHFLSVSDLTRQANCTEPGACQVQHICTSWGRKVNLRWQTLTIALPAWSYPRHERWKGGETVSLQREIKTTYQPNFQTQAEENYRKVTPSPPCALQVQCRQFYISLIFCSYFFTLVCPIFLTDYYFFNQS